MGIHQSIRNSRERSPRLVRSAISVRRRLHYDINGVCRIFSGGSGRAHTNLEGRTRWPNNNSRNFILFKAGRTNEISRSATRVRSSFSY
jgi:hypothetical protein